MPPGRMKSAASLKNSAKRKNCAAASMCPYYRQSPTTKKAALSCRLETYCNCRSNLMAHLNQPGFYPFRSLHYFHNVNTRTVVTADGDGAIGCYMAARFHYSAQPIHDTHIHRLCTGALHYQGELGDRRVGKNIFLSRRVSRFSSALLEGCSCGDP